MSGPVGGPEVGGAEVDSLIELREQMTRVTDDLVHLLDIRTAIGRQIGTIKAERGAEQIRDLTREAEVLDHAVAISDGTTEPDGLRRIIQVVMNVSSEDQAHHTGLPLGVPTRQDEPLFGPPVRPDDVKVIPRRGW